MRDRERGILGVPDCEAVRVHLFFLFFFLRFARGKAKSCQHSFPVIGFSCDGLGTSFPSLSVPLMQLASQPVQSVLLKMAWVRSSGGRFLGEGIERAIVFVMLQTFSRTAGPHRRLWATRSEEWGVNKTVFFSSFFGSLVRRRLFEHVVSL